MTNLSCRLIKIYDVFSNNKNELKTNFPNKRKTFHSTALALGVSKIWGFRICTNPKYPNPKTPSTCTNPRFYKTYKSQYKMVRKC